MQPTPRDLSWERKGRWGVRVASEVGGSLWPGPGISMNGGQECPFGKKSECGEGVYERGRPERPDQGVPCKESP